MPDLSNFTEVELRAELSRRETKEREDSKPKMVESPDLTELKRLCQSHIDDIATGAYIDDDSDNWFYETAMETFFGKDIFKWINANREDE